MPTLCRLASCLFTLTTLLLATPLLAADWPPDDMQPLTWEGDISRRMVDGCDRFLLRKIEEAAAHRAQLWEPYNQRLPYSPAAINHFRRHLEFRLGMRDERLRVRDERHQPIVMQSATSLLESRVLVKGADYDLMRVRWQVFGNVYGEGLLAQPHGEPKANLVAIPDADIAPEAMFGLAEGVPAESQFARLLAEQGCRVLVPMLIDRTLEKRRGRANLTNREFLYRPAYVLGRHLIGYELNKVLAGVDWLEQQSEDEESPRVGVVGWGEGGMLALYAGAIDRRIDAICVSGYFNQRERIWEEPISRNVAGRLERLGDAELAFMIHPRSLLVEACRAPELTLPSEGGAPAVLKTPALYDVQQEWERFMRIMWPTEVPAQHKLIVSGEKGGGPYGTSETLRWFLEHGLEVSYEEDRESQVFDNKDMPEGFEQFARERMQRQIEQIVDHNRQALHDSADVRREYMQDLDTSSLENFVESQESYREFFSQVVIGDFEQDPLPFNPRIRQTYDEEKWTGYEVVLDVFPDVFAYGILLVPKDIKPGEKRPVVVCQHGLEGRPQDVVSGDHRAYHDYAAKLAERGFVTFAPQNIYIHGDRFRTLQRKAYPLNKTLFSIMVPQHQQITDWLGTLPFVDRERIGFYGLSYGGKSAMRIPPLVDNYCLSICSADFNEWVWKNASTDDPHSYVWTGEYEIFEFGLGASFNYAEMAALIAPRPFMVERGHFDGVAPDEQVAYEFAKVRHLYAAQLGIGERCEIEWFVGPHTINGKGTFDFLHRHLEWPQPEESKQ